MLVTKIERTKVESKSQLFACFPATFPCHRTRQKEIENIAGDNSFDFEKIELILRFISDLICTLSFYHIKSHIHRGVQSQRKQSCLIQYINLLTIVHEDKLH
jgi:hypothetical protein